MQKTCLTKALTHVTQQELFLYADHMQHLYNQLQEFATLMNAIYSDMKIPGKFYVSIDKERYTEVSVRHIIDLYEGREKELKKMSDDQFHQTRITSEHYWDIHFNIKNKEFELLYGRDNDEDDPYYFRSSGEKCVSGKYRKYPLIERGYQKLVYELSLLLSEFLPMDAQLERLRRIDLPTGQQSFKFG